MATLPPYTSHRSTDNHSRHGYGTKQGREARDDRIQESNEALSTEGSEVDLFRWVGGPTRVFVFLPYRRPLRRKLWFHGPSGAVACPT